MLSRIRKVPTAIWLTSTQSVTKGHRGNIASRVLASAAKKKRLVTFVVYNLPNRDCAAGASAGEYCCMKKKENKCDMTGSDECSYGLRQYRRLFIDRLSRSVREYCDKVPMAFIIEPDSLPNLVTNLGMPNCGSSATLSSYRKGISYAVRKLSSACRKAAIYVDAGHGGWLGWKDNCEGFADLIRDMGISKRMRGFAINVANYNALGVMCPTSGFCDGGKNADAECCKDDPCQLTGTYNPGFTELNYAMSLKKMGGERIPGFKPRFVIDTSRNGKGDARAECSNWCNIRDAGIGEFPTGKTRYPGIVDAYLWVKPPGESDGCTKVLPGGSECPRFSESCASEDSIGNSPNEPRAPEAGDWFAYNLKRLAMN